MKYLKKFNEAKTRKEYDSSIETVNQFVSDVFSLFREHYYIYELDVVSIQRIATSFERKTKTEIIEFLPLNYNDNDLKLIITLILNMGYTTSYIKNFNYEVMGKAINKICKSFSFDDEHPDKEWDYNGVDIEHSSILATSFDIKDSLTPDNIEYYMERTDDVDEYSMFRLIFQKIFQYGYSIGRIQKDKKRDEIADNIDRFIKNKNRTPEEDEEFTKIYKDYIDSMD